MKKYIALLLAATLEGKPRNDDFKANHRQNGQNTGQQGNGSVLQWQRCNVGN